MKKLLFLSAFLCTLSFGAFAQSEVSTDDAVFVVVEEQAMFPGGMEAMYDYIGKNLKYPELAKEKDIQGRVFVNFIVERDGSITNVKCLRGIGGGCDEAAMEVVKNMPKWQPAKQRGKEVRCQFNLPINFELSENKK